MFQSSEVPRLDIGSVTGEETQDRYVDSRTDRLDMDKVKNYKENT